MWRHLDRDLDADLESVFPRRRGGWCLKAGGVGVQRLVRVTNRGDLDVDDLLFYDETLSYLHADHLGSSSLATDADGGVISEMRYYPYGETRTGAMETDRQYTGQRLEAGTGLYDYNARFYDPYLNRFIQADTIVPNPGNPQSLNRYSYALGNPIRFNDPSGHCSGDPNDPENPDAGCWGMVRQIEDSYDNVSVANTDLWTETELILLLEALQEYPLWKYLYSAEDIVFGREACGFDRYVGGVTAPVTDKKYLQQLAPSDLENYTVTIYDFAWYARPDAEHSDIGIYLWFMKSSNKFKGVVAHELTHVVQFETHDFESGASYTVNDFIDATGGGLPFDTDYYRELDTRESMVITVAIYQYGNSESLTKSHITWINSVTAPSVFLPVTLKE